MNPDETKKVTVQSNKRRSRLLKTLGVVLCLILSFGLAMVGYVDLQEAALQKSFVDIEATRVANDEAATYQQETAKEQEFKTEEKNLAAKEEEFRAEEKDLFAKEEEFRAQEKDLLAKEDNFRIQVQKDFVAKDEAYKTQQARVEAEKEELKKHSAELEAKLKEQSDAEATLVGKISHLQSLVDKLEVEKKEAELNDQTRSLLDVYRKIANRTAQLATEKHDQHLVDLLVNIGFLDNQIQPTPAPSVPTPTPTVHPEYTVDDLNRKLGGLAGGLIALSPTDENAAEIVKEFGIKQTNPPPTPSVSPTPGPSVTPAPTPVPSPTAAPTPVPTPTHHIPTTTPVPLEHHSLA